ncbi:MAG: hypothetical protein RL095_618 [Verrucomicrobiota bacterium]|jgi:tRNA dimethylallyltransferase
MAPELLVILGPTASGKSELSLRLARRLGAEILSCDSMQIYRGMDIGTAKPGRDELSEIAHHLVDELDLSEEFSAQDFLDRVKPRIEEIRKRGRLPILVGGTGLYAKMLLYGGQSLPHDSGLATQLRARLETEGAAPLWLELGQIDAAAVDACAGNPRRLLRALEAAMLLGGPLPQRQLSPQALPGVLQVILLPDAAISRQRIEGRAREMLRQGWIEEVETLRSQGLEQAPTAAQAIGYRDILRHLRGELSRADLEEAILIATRQYAKRQRTWFRHQHPGAEFASPASSSDLAALEESLLRRI